MKLKGSFSGEIKAAGLFFSSSRFTIDVGPDWEDDLLFQISVAPTASFRCTDANREHVGFDKLRLKIPYSIIKELGSGALGGYVSYAYKLGATEFSWSYAYEETSVQMFMGPIGPEERFSMVVTRPQALDVTARFTKCYVDLHKWAKEIIEQMKPVEKEVAKIAGLMKAEDFE